MKSFKDKYISDTPMSVADNSATSLSKTYQKKTDKQHVLDNPDTYTGSMELSDYNCHIWDDETKHIREKEISMIPGLYKLYDEIIVNCRDHHVRQAQAIASGKEVNSVTNIEISVNDGFVTMVNDGDGIDIVKHPEYDIWIPEMIFAHLRTSTNYDKTQKKIVGGKNGFGSKITFIWSSEGLIETVDAKRKLKYVQKFKNNLDIIEKPTITKYTRKPYTKLSFKPDFERLKLHGFSDDMLALFHRRAYDIAAVTDKKVKVHFNGNLLPVKNFQQYVDLYIGTKSDTPRIYEEANERWEYAVCITPKDEFAQVSFVNGIFTSKGGKHVDYILGQLTRKLVAFIKKKKKVDVKAGTIKEQLMLFVRCDVENPSFDSQTKDHLNTDIKKFGSSCEISDKFVEKVAKMGVMDAACALTEVKETKAVKKNDGTKSKNIRGLPKLVDANFAGTAKSSDCTLILCEGDSAKAGIMSGLEKKDRDIIGVYPLKGKLFNVRGENQKRIAENKEITDIKHIMGLEVGKEYTEEIVKKKLRYGKILFMTDQDLDGSHIKGLGINLFDAEWKTLMNIPGFIGFMNTPILKAKKGKTELQFYNEGEYETWKDNTDTSGWNIKYYKGLGTSTSAEFKEYFAKKKLVSFESTGEDSHDAVDKVFNKKRAADRKEWLEEYDNTAYLDTGSETVSYEDFIEKEMIHFSKYDCERSIPCIVDGLKTSLRKILYTAFLRKLTKEIKVAQFSGSVSEKSGYHHGEASLNGGIIHMAQDFVGSNNINLLKPNGQFGTRLEGGSDAASERYIFTHLSEITRYIYPEADDKVLKYLDDDGTLVEPQYYAPIIPMLLVNGSKGIGTGFSTDIPSYNPIQLIDYIESRLAGKSVEHITLLPYYRGFAGTISVISDNKYLIRGKYEVLSNNKIRVTELPVGYWTNDFKKHLEDLIDPEINKKSDSSKKKKAKGFVKDYCDSCTEKLVDFTIEFNDGYLPKLLSAVADYSCNGLEKLLKLYTTKTTTNMHVFDENEQLKLYETPGEIIDYYMKVRLNIYVERKANQIATLKRLVLLLTNKAKFIAYILNDTIDLRKKKKEVVYELLDVHDFDKIDGDYKYLTKMPMDMLTQEEIDALNKEKGDKEAQLKTLEETNVVDMWRQELFTLRDRLNKIDKVADLSHDTTSELAQLNTVSKKAKKVIVTNKAKKLKIKTNPS